MLGSLGVAACIRGEGVSAADVCVTDGVYICGSTARVIRVPPDPLLAAATLVGFLEAGVREVLVGVDTGPVKKYAVIVNDVLLDHGVVDDEASFAQHMCRLYSYVKPRRMIVRVGVDGEGAEELALLIRRECPGIVVELTSEHGTTRRRGLFPPAGLRTACPHPLDRDAEAAVIIALKPGLRIE